jgi:hypothetical protein
MGKCSGGLDTYSVPLLNSILSLPAILTFDLNLSYIPRRNQ